MESLRTAVEDAVGRRVEQMTVVRGGDVAAAFRVELDDGTRLFAKTHPSPPPGFFTTEAASLSWLRDADAVPVPTVVAVSDGADSAPAFLILEWIDEGRPAESTERSLGCVAGRAPRCRRPELRPRGPADDRQPRVAERPATDVAGVLRDVPAAPAGPAGEGRRRAPRRDDRPAWSASPDRWNASTPASRRRGSTATCGPATGSSTRRPQLADRPGRARRAPRVRPRHDAAVRRILGRLLRGVRRAATRCRRTGRSASPSTRSRHSSCTRSSSAAATSPPPPPPSPATDPVPPPSHEVSAS